mmetsp:Transcript_1573/g.2715  ORF Transcript_1573/g.2715 Transcript_1573/m.2715 type:complete len:376 (-) Transcript_1573:699-1826(-)|eukprot:CAMPEP_0198231822 /NCGR_PEP_ID=MMETSP1445-20131203/115403_1 /TAXON_ID=36898 /ORGANISM="Pyramimonas sp., Strain CCMP2087" /LENGTH=375 /DNA_ID=CAMNT_0043912459 /DNA_START=526 /DNA_END=1653 /DNA_ORIENTATION=-
MTIIRSVKPILLLLLSHLSLAATLGKEEGVGIDRDYIRRKERRGNSVLESAVQKYATDGVVLLAFTNWGDCQTLFPDNFVHTLINTRRSNYMLVATDNTAYAYLKCRGFNAYNDAASFQGSKLTEAVSGYQDDLHSPYHALALGRFHIVSQVLDMGYHVIFSDTDVVIIKDPIPVLLRSPHDVLFLWDGANTADGKTHLLGRGTAGTKGQIQSNAGFFFVRNNDKTLAWFSHVHEMMGEEARLRSEGKGKRNDQEIIAASLEIAELAEARVESLTWKLLPRGELVNGWLIKNQYKDGALKTPGCLATGPNAMKHTRTWIAVHMNYNRGFKRKLLHFKRCGLWQCEFCVTPEINVCKTMVEGWGNRREQGFNKDDY